MLYSNGRGAGVNNQPVPANGKTYLSTLEQVVAHFDVDPTNGTLTQKDYFEPANFDSLNGGDRDFSSSGVALLDPVFSGGGVNRIAIGAGKVGIVRIRDISRSLTPMN
jgi:hypothetical protein